MDGEGTSILLALGVVMLAIGILYVLLRDRVKGRRGSD
jgi:LPXTG-motif cell wall-anchored protein